MKFDKNRFAKLAGIPQSRGTLNESRRRKAMRRRAMLNEGLYGGRSERMIDTFDPFDDEEVEMMHFDERGLEDPRRVSTQFNLDDLDGDDYAQMMYDDYLDGGVDDDDNLYEGMGHMHEKDMEEGMGHMYEKDMEEGMYEEEEAEEAMVEIDDSELMKEVRNIKRKRINEARLKAVIEDELREVLAEMQYGSDWMYGSDKPTASKSGSVTRGFKGFGFK